MTMTQGSLGGGGVVNSRVGRFFMLFKKAGTGEQSAVEGGYFWNPCIINSDDEGEGVGQQHRLAGHNRLFSLTEFYFEQREIFHQ